MAVDWRIVAENLRVIVLMSAFAFHDIRRSRRQARMIHDKKAGIISK